MTPDTFIRNELALREKQGLLRARRISGTPMRANFSSNDYLALSTDEAVIAAFREALQRYGAGSTGSPLTAGYHHAHQVLEEALADYLGVEAVLLFSSGYAANSGALNVLRRIGYTPILDKLCHASLYEGAGDKPLRYRHNDLDHLTDQLIGLPDNQDVVVVTESVFSMDGDQWDGTGLHALCDKMDTARTGATHIFLDHAHGLGVTEVVTPSNQIKLQTGTFGKALGNGGAYVAGDRDWIDYLQQQCRHYIYSTAFGPAQAAAIHRALQIIGDEPERRTMLRDYVDYFRQGAESLGLKLAPSQTPIQPLLVGDSGLAMRLSEALRQKGIVCVAIRPPTVPPGTARLRFTVTLHHDHAAIDHLFSALQEVLQQDPELAEVCCAA